MASLVVNQGLQRIAINASIVGGGAAIGASQTVTRYIMTMAVDDASEAFLAADTKLNDGTGYTQQFDQLLTALATRSNQTTSHSTVIGTADGNFGIKRFSLHDDTATNVTASSTTLVCGVDGQSLTKTSDFTMTPTLNLLYTSV